ncbi:MAG: hypothetical protein P8Y71_20740 [Pseudolabrys sp.]
MKRIAIAILALAFLVEPAFVYAQQSDQDARERAAEKKKEEDNPLLKEYHEQQKDNNTSACCGRPTRAPRRRR